MDELFTGLTIVFLYKDSFQKVLVVEMTDLSYYIKQIYDVAFVNFFILLSYHTIILISLIFSPLI